MPSTWVKARDAFLEGVAFLAQFIAPIAVVAASLVGMPPGIANILRAIPALISAAEIAIPESGSGPAKKQQVLDALRAFLAVIESRATGQAKVNFDQLKPLFESIIDNGESAINFYAKNIIADNAEATGPPQMGSGIHAPIDSP